jgi:hypothetical protein
LLENNELILKFVVMKKIIFICFFIHLLLVCNAQFQVDFEFGGASFFGFSNNIRYNIQLDQKAEVFIVPRIGFGFSLPPWDGTGKSLNMGLNLRVKKVEFGIDVCNYFFSNYLQNHYFSLFPNENYRYYVDPFIITYPNIKYYFIKRPHYFMNAGVGILIPFEKTRNGYTSVDLAPSANITAGIYLGKL